MFTTCPNCARQYRIRAGQISAAAGEVRCGYCGEQFNSLGRLSDELLPIADQSYIDSSEAAAGQTADIKEEGLSRVNTDILGPEPQFEIPESDPATVPGINLSKVSREGESSVNIPEILLEDKPAPRNLLASVLWGVGVFLLIILVSAQLAWFNRDYILQQYPELIPLAEQLCEQYNCKLYRHRHISAIRLLNRDVRLHPLYSDTLLINASMANTSEKIQPFPHIQFTLFDTNGGLVAFREFIPGEYLDDSIEINKGMHPDQPVHFALEVTGPTEGAVSFEFRFL